MEENKKLQKFAIKLRDFANEYNKNNVQFSENLNNCILNSIKNTPIIHKEQDEFCHLEKVIGAIDNNIAESHILTNSIPAHIFALYNKDIDFDNVEYVPNIIILKSRKKDDMLIIDDFKINSISFNLKEF